MQGSDHTFLGFLGSDTNSSPISAFGAAISGVVQPDGGIYACISQTGDENCDHEGAFGHSNNYSFFLALAPLEAQVFDVHGTFNDGGSLSGSITVSNDTITQWNLMAHVTDESGNAFDAHLLNDNSQCRLTANICNFATIDGSFYRFATQVDPYQTVFLHFGLDGDQAINGDIRFHYAETIRTLVVPEPSVICIAVFSLVLLIARLKSREQQGGCPSRV